MSEKISLDSSDGPDIIPKDKDELHLIAVEKGLKEYDVALDAGSRRYDLRITAIK